MYINMNHVLLIYEAILKEKYKIVRYKILFDGLLIEFSYPPHSYIETWVPPMTWNRWK
jgi:hypothetical protein